MTSYLRHAGMCRVLADYPQWTTMVLVWAVIGFITLVVGEIAPKSIAMQHAEKIALGSRD